MPAKKATPRRLRLLALVLLALVLLLALAAWSLVHLQGPRVEELGDGVRVRWDRWGIPTIDGPDWERVVEAQGYVLASQRLWQMDLSRRASLGRLAEWFGPPAVPVDRKRRLEDWPGVAERAARALLPEDRQPCEAFARGVNRFIEEHPHRWGLEYLLLRVRPEPWRCADSMAVVLSMAETLSTSWGMDARRAGWEALPPAWRDFLLPRDHPWNQPLFGRPGRLELPPPEEALPPYRGELGALRTAGPLPSAVGSNDWAWRGQDAAYLANDPHLANSVPQLWFALRMRVAPDDWVAGVAIPGIPGVILGMNPHLAFAFTNTGEDVDDLLYETLSPDGRSVLDPPPPPEEPGEEATSAGEGGEPSPEAEPEERWSPVRELSSVIRVRGGEDVRVVARWTPRGPLRPCPGEPERWCSRQWLPLLHPQPGLPVLALDRARDWEELNDALDRFTFPAQNVLMLDREGNMGYRVSGTGVRRRAVGDRPLPAAEGAWLGFEPPSERRRLYLPRSEGSPAFLVTANQRIWVDPWNRNWDSDLRADRIRTLLSSRSDFTREDMERLQLDTHSRYLRLVLRWVAEHASPASDEDRRRVERWRAWDGDAQSDPRSFTEALAAERALRGALLQRVREVLLPELDSEVSYPSPMPDAWVLVTLSSPEGVQRFGLDPGRLADHLLQVAAQEPVLYTEQNWWGAQHPFVGRVPVLGGLFRVPSWKQVGYYDLVRVESPHHGASTRLVWDLVHPERSTWIFPVGESGHAGQAHYDDLQPLWRRGERVPVFPEGW